MPSAPMYDGKHWCDRKEVMQARLLIAGNIGLGNKPKPLGALLTDMNKLGWYVFSAYVAPQTGRFRANVRLYGSSQGNVRLYQGQRSFSFSDSQEYGDADPANDTIEYAILAALKKACHRLTTVGHGAIVPLGPMTPEAIQKEALGRFHVEEAKQDMLGSEGFLIALHLAARARKANTETRHGWN